MRIGIITLFHNSGNYGGLLQSYALCKVIENTVSDVTVEQISYNPIEWSFYKKTKFYLRRKTADFIKLFIPKRRKAMLSGRKKLRLSASFVNKFRIAVRFTILKILKSVCRNMIFL